MEGLLEIQHLYLQFWKLLSKNQGQGRDSRGNDEHKQAMSVRPFLPRAPFTALGKCSRERDGTR